MATTLAEIVTQADMLPPFQNEQVADFSKPENREGMERALAAVRTQLGREYDILIAGEHIKTGDLLKSLNPSRGGMATRPLCAFSRSRRTSPDRRRFFRDMADVRQSRSAIVE